MRKPTKIDRLYLDFDGFFASVEQLRDPSIRGRPVGVVPYEGGKTCIIACSREAKAAGVKNIMMTEDARKLCPDMILVPQRPALYRRAHHALVSEIESVIQIDVVKSIDELSCKLDENHIADPEALSRAIKSAILDNFGPWITCSIGMAANRHLAKIACARDKPNGLTIWHPEIMPDPLFEIPLADITGVGDGMIERLRRANILTTEDLYNTQPKQARALWRNVTGERLWYALHGYEIEAEKSKRGMFGHARVLPPDQRDQSSAREIARLLTIKATRRLRRAGYYASGFYLWIRFYEKSWFADLSLPQVNDDQAILSALRTLWARMTQQVPARLKIKRVGITLYKITPARQRQLDFLLNDDRDRQRWERIGEALDAVNGRFGKTVASIGPWAPPKGGNVGGKISFTRIPSAEDFA